MLLLQVLAESRERYKSGLCLSAYFVLQAEDGLRDICLSRGLGDVYQRQIWIREYKKDGNYVFEVADDGPGISEKHLPRIFNMGYSTKFDEKTGNIYRGVGLCGVKNAVEEQFEGSISVDSEEGRGTKFHIEIPIAKLEEIE